MVNLSVGRGEKLPPSQGAGLTAKGREKHNRETGSNLQAPAPNPKTKKDAARRKSFCARSRGWTGERGRAARRRWNCNKGGLIQANCGASMKPTQRSSRKS